MLHKEKLYILIEKQKAIQKAINVNGLMHNAC
jgi:hypothetical protein